MKKAKNKHYFSFNGFGGIEVGATTISGERLP